MPNKEQEVLLSKHFGCVRYIYNHFLNERKEQYLKNKKSDNYQRQAASLTTLKKQDETLWLKEVNSQTLQSALRFLDTAFVNFFRGNAKFPRFKTRKGKNSFTVPQFVEVEGDRLFFPKFKDGIRLTLHRPIEGQVKHCTVSKTPAGKYFVSILCQVRYIPKNPTGKCCGVDLGIKNLLVTSDGMRFKNSRHTRKYERRLAKAQKHLSRKIKGSNNRDRQRLNVATVHEKITNTRLDMLHKVSTQITNEYDIICVEDLNVKAMMVNRKLAKHISDASWGIFAQGCWNTKPIGITSRL